MAAIMTRSFADFAGFNWPKDVAYTISDWRGSKVVTYTELREERQRKQAEHLADLREPAPPAALPCYVWTFHNDWSFPYGGWYCYVVTRHFDIAVNFRHFDLELVTSIMEAMPVGVFPIEANFVRWMEAFAERYPRRHPEDPRKAGSRVGWLVDRKRFTLDKPMED